MLHAIVFGIAAGAGFQAWRHLPGDGPVTATGAWLVLAVATVAAYLAGRWHGRGRPSFAVASSHAEAHAQAVAAGNVLNVQVLGSPAAAGTADLRAPDPIRTRFPDEAVGWFGGQRPQLDADQLDGMELGELVEHGFDREAMENERERQ